MLFLEKVRGYVRIAIMLSSTLKRKKRKRKKEVMPELFIYKKVRDFRNIFGQKSLL